MESAGSELSLLLAVATQPTLHAWWFSLYLATALTGPNPARLAHQGCLVSGCDLRDAELGGRPDGLSCHTKKVRTILSTCMLRGRANHADSRPRVPPADCGWRVCQPRLSDCLQFLACGWVAGAWRGMGEHSVVLGVPSLCHGACLGAFVVQSLFTDAGR